MRYRYCVWPFKVTFKFSYSPVCYKQVDMCQGYCPCGRSEISWGKDSVTVCKLSFIMYSLHLACARIIVVKDKLCLKVCNYSRFITLYLPIFILVQSRLLIFSVSPVVFILFCFVICIVLLCILCSVMLWVCRSPIHLNEHHAIN